ncbi:MAG: 2-oxo acid dehydrogenase subunit E2, partial [Propionibacteriaceae bacterium]|nr:2-oxo acid dehydrogenase subunit E2 [Propionibacteriaceae bacterium]
MYITGRRPWFGRRDGKLVKKLPSVRRIVPHLMPTRVESMVYYPSHLDVERMQIWLDEYNATRPEAERVKFFHIFLTAFARLYRQRPELNRFISGRRTYQHSDIHFSFTVKQAMTDEAAEVQAHLKFTGLETVDEVRALIEKALARARDPRKNYSNQLIDVLVHVPGPILGLIARLAFALDAVNLMPKFLQDAIPMYTSAYLVNLGSLNAEAPFHHLYQRGTASVFVSIGTIRPEPVVDEDGRIVARRRVDVVYTIDERVTDGFYLVRSSQVLQAMFDDPGSLT